MVRACRTSCSRLRSWAWQLPAEGYLHAVGWRFGARPTRRGPRRRRCALSPAESEIGRLLLKGLSHHEIADLRGVSERTARQQAQSLYKKAGLPGRAGLSAYFLEDLLGPREALKAGAVSR